MRLPPTRPSRTAIDRGPSWSEKPSRLANSKADPARPAVRIQEIADLRDTGTSAIAPRASIRALKNSLVRPRCALRLVSTEPHRHPLLRMSGTLSRRQTRQRHPARAVPCRRGDLDPESPVGGRARDPECRPWDQSLGGDARLVGAEIECTGAGHRSAVCGRVLRRRAPAELWRHGRVVFRLGARRDEIIREMLRAGARVHMQLDTESLLQWEIALIGEQADVVVVLADGAEGETFRAPAQIGLAKGDLARAWLERRQQRRRLRPIDQRGVRGIDLGSREWAWPLRGCGGRHTGRM